MSLAKRLASQSSLIFGGRLFGAGLTFLVQAFIARAWGATILADYLIAIAAVNLIAVVMPLGFHTIGTYFAAEYRARGDRQQLIAFLVRAYAHIGVVFVPVILAGPMLLSAIGQGGSDIARHFVPIALLALATAITYVNGAVLVGLKRPYAGFFADSIFRPMLVLGTFTLCALFIDVPQDGFDTMLWAIAFGFVLISVVHFGFVVVSVRRIEQSSASAVSDVPRWWRFAAPWVLITIATDFFFDIDLLLLANLLSKEDLAIFGVCTRIFALASFGVGAVYAVILPEMFESQANADRASFDRKLGQANLAASLASVALFIGAAITAPFALLLFGPEFTTGAMPLSLLCLALVVRSVMGPASMVLSIHDRPWASLPAVALGMATLVVGNYLLVPAYGLIGAALAAIIAIALWSVALWLVALKTAKIDVSLLHWLRVRQSR